MTEEELKNRTKELALRVIRLARSLPKDGVAKILGNQIVRSATSVAANYRSACKGSFEGWLHIQTARKSRWNAEP